MAILAFCTQELLGAVNISPEHGTYKWVSIEEAPTNEYLLAVYHKALTLIKKKRDNMKKIMTLFSLLIISISVATALEKESKIYIAGHRGLVGSALIKRLQELGYQHVITKTHNELDLCNQAAVDHFFATEHPDYDF